MVFLLVTVIDREPFVLGEHLSFLVVVFHPSSLSQDIYVRRSVVPGFGMAVLLTAEPLGERSANVAGGFDC